MATAGHPAEATGAYEAAYAAMADRAALGRLARRLEPTEVVFVPGFLARYVQRTGIPPCGVGPRRYFGLQRTWLDREGIAQRYLELDSEAPVGANAAGVARAIEAAGPRVVLVTHSKGCLDSLAALVGSVEARARVVAWVAIQGPFQGAALADLAGRLGIVAVLSRFGGSGGAIDDMRGERRRAWHAAHAAGIAAVLATVPTICYSSQVDGRGCLSVLDRLSRWAGAGPNDGLVGPDSALLDGAPGVVQAGVDHAMPVLDSDPDRLDPVRCLAALLSVRLAMP